VPAPKERNTEAEKAAIKEGRVPEDWKPAKVRQKDRDACWSIKYSKAKVREGGDPKAAKPVDLAIPMFGYKKHIGIDKAHGLIRTWDASTANAHDGARLPVLISKKPLPPASGLIPPIDPRRTRRSSRMVCSPATSTRSESQGDRCPNR
jgi:hypothetical protein